MNLSLKNLDAYIFTFLIILPWSPVFSWMIGLDGKIIFLLLLLGFLFASFNKFSVNKITLLSLVLFVTILLLLSIIGNKPNLLISMLGLPLSVFLTQHIFKCKGKIELVVYLLTLFSTFAIIFSFIGQVYAFLGGSSILEISNYDGRLNHLYLTTFSNAHIGNLIRPSFIYDEPGALSFVIIFTVIVRELSGRSKLHTSLLLLSGMVTLSLTHFLVLLIYIFSNFRGRYILVSSFLLLPLAILILNAEIFSPFSNRVDDLIDGKDNNRTRQIDNFFNNVEISEVFWVGVNDCSDPDHCYEKYGDITSNPLSVFFGKGILGLICQLFIYGVLVRCLFKLELFFPAIAMILLITQRPYISAVGYSTMIVFTMYYLNYTKNHRLKNKS
ncbi:Whole genome shotgun sequence [Vibrio jasicida]|uniref:Whole genome shotgun sequence n=1 Tax=Vibrio jasicida TaxID=766224 RepID=A0AAU9QXL0_9VIBR|nr:Whole genome shotgun sequence [Vibrio jasicida]CAH1602735.1 Whole genome shotgun sequence [Vibrio jasicida]